jgi:threonine aldolase
MIFTSDNAVGAAPEILAAIAAANEGAFPSYGADPLMTDVEALIAEIFETECRVFLVATGTAANALALASLSPPWGAVFCHRHAHIEVDECGAPEFFGGGLKLVLLDGPNGKIEPDTLRKALQETGAGGVHQVQPAALSLTNVTEAGALYRADEIAALASLAHEAGCAVHLDGTRFANALVASNASPADMSWRAGVDVLCLGATKNGALAAETVIFFDPTRQADRIAEFEYRRKRGGHLISKGRLLSSQMAAYLEDDLWLSLARHSNTAAARLAAGLEAISGVEIENSVDANMLFVHLPLRVHRALQQQGARYYLEPPSQTDEGNGETVRVRFVTSFSTSEAEIDAFLSIASGA